ncbi:MAG: lysostaphin resistance A-like protein [Pyrinomonadaceae bacterium]
MATPNFLFNEAGRLRSGWRLTVFIAVFIAVAIFIFGALFVVLFAVSGRSATGLPTALAGVWEYVAQFAVLLVTATLVGWACGRLIEGLPWRALGWTPHQGWLRDLLLGSLVGALSLLLAAALVTATGGFTFGPSAAAWPAVLRTLAVSASFFVFAAAAEEVLFRGYPLQTMLRSQPAWVALIPSSILFACVHLSNPNVAPGFTFVNTALAGVWLAVAYIRTRSLWFPLGVHWAWNWTMGALLGLPVSGITEVTAAPLLRPTDYGPVWFTGGAYGVEGGAACTIALLISTAFIWRTRLVTATPELKQLTSEEIPNVPAGPVVSRDQSRDSSGAV